MDLANTQEIELKLVVLGLSGHDALQRLRRSRTLSGRALTQQWLVNRYVDTPERDLQRHRCALRLRHIASSPPSADPSQPGVWIQTLKTAGLSAAGLSQRGEWESRVAGDALSRDALRGTGWDALDPDDVWFAQLQPVFETHCLRTTWQVRRRDGTHIEVALDDGTVVAANRRAAFVELELELVHGQPEALFALAQALAERVPCLPGQRSKAEQGQALWANTLYDPIRAHPPQAARHEPLAALAVRALHEMYDQFTGNLERLMHSDAPELVHQARVGWRRWRSLAKLLRPWLGDPLDLTPLKPLLKALGRQRNLDVAHTQTLPLWAPAWPGSATLWQAGMTALQTARDGQRVRLRAEVASTSVGLTLLHIAYTLWRLSQQPPQGLTQRHAYHRLARWHRRLLGLLDGGGSDWIDMAALHEARLLAKQLRYGSEALGHALPAKRRRQTRAWLDDAMAWQTHIGESRDAWEAAACLESLQVGPTMVGFLQGIGAAMDRATQQRAMDQRVKARRAP